MAGKRVSKRNKGEVFSHWWDTECTVRVKQARDPHTSFAATEPKGSIRTS